MEPTMTNPPQRVVILGGGMSALTAALELTDPSQHGKYDVTVYQMGWRLGGQGASGRNRKLADRIEEHGLHIWCGFYENAFRLMRTVYAEMARSPHAPLATWDAAFKPQDVVVYPHLIDNKWDFWELDFPTNFMKPGDHTPFPFTLAGALELAIKWLYEFYKGWTGPTPHAPTVPAGHPIENFTKPHWWHQAHADAGMIPLENPSHFDLISLAHHTIQSAGTVTADHHPILIEILTLFVEGVWAFLGDKVLNNLDARRHWMIIYLGATALAGMLKDNLIFDGLSKIDGSDFLDWLSSNALLTDATANEVGITGSVLPFAIYNIAFSYENGESSKPNMSAAVALSLALRIVVGYKGSVLWKMQAGMGDTVFAPIYTVLQRRGVKFHYFNQVRSLNPGKGQIDSITIDRQVDLTVGEYDPLILVKGVPCWPNEPLYDQIDPTQAAILELDHIDLEQANNGWINVTQFTLTAGQDYDHIILGIPVAALKDVCAEIIAASTAWQQMTSGVQTVQTQAMQYWLNKDLAGLGCPYPSALLGTYVMPFSTVGDYSQLIPVENWPASANLQNITYVCDVLPDTFPNQQQANDQVKSNSLTFLENYTGQMWPKAAGHDKRLPNSIDWSLLIAPSSLAGGERFNAQYWRANIDPASRYAQCIADTAQYRLKTNATGYSNLSITGVWIDNGFHMGCIEGAAMSGMLTAQAISGKPATIANI
jgi:uncharacterized protein with NAD-binding domain and iron-sulfur cluster